MAPTICSDEDLHLRKRVRETRKRLESDTMNRNSANASSSTNQSDGSHNKVLNRMQPSQSVRSVRRFISISRLGGNHFDENLPNRMQFDNLNSDSAAFRHRRSHADYNDENSNSTLISEASVSSSSSSSSPRTFVLSSPQSAASEAMSSSTNAFCDSVLTPTIVSTLASSVAASLSSTASSPVLFETLGASLSSPSHSSATDLSDCIETSHSSRNDFCADGALLHIKSKQKRHHPYSENALSHRHHRYYHHHHHRNNINYKSNERSKSILKDKAKNVNDSYTQLSKLKSIYNSKKIDIEPTYAIKTSSTLETTSTIFADDDFDKNEAKIRSILQQKLNLYGKNGGGKCDKNFFRTKGLVEIAIKTIKLVRRNQMLQMRLHQLQMETKEFVQSVISNPQNRAIAQCNVTIDDPMTDDMQLPHTHSDHHHHHHSHPSHRHHHVEMNNQNQIEISKLDLNISDNLNSNDTNHDNISINSKQKQQQQLINNNNNIKSNIENNDNNNSNLNIKSISNSDKIIVGSLIIH